MLIQSRNINDYKPILEGLVEDFGYAYYHAILAWCRVIDDDTPENFWQVYLVTDDVADDSKAPIGKVVGICGLYSHTASTDELWLGWFGIVPERRNGGIGKEVLDALKDIAYNYNAAKLMSYVDKEGAPLNFYYRNGFELIGRVGEYIKDKPSLNVKEHFEDAEDFIIQYKIYV